jgi:pectate lyase
MKYQLILLALTITAARAGSQPAFPGAEGFAWQTAGGRGGDVVHVSNLADSGPGSLRDAVSREHRTVVFDVGGYIQLKSVLAVASRITIAGQTAPGDGIGIAGAEVSLSNSHDLIIRFVRIRQGLSPGEDKKSAININTGHDIILDHLSVQWGRWDTIDMNLSTNITIQNCIIGPGVDPQRFGCLCQCDNVTWSHNLFIDNQSRNPKAKGRIQYVNNIVYNWGVCGLVGGHSQADHVLDVIGNYFIAGPNSSPHALGEFWPSDHTYSSGNFIDADKDGVLNGRPVVAADFGEGKNGPTLMDGPTVTPSPPLTIDTAQVAYDKALAGAGDCLHRDSVDQRLIADLQSLGKSGQTIHDPATMGGFGELHGGTAPLDSDGDGIPDDWELAHGMNPHDPTDANKLDKDGYTMLEEYVNSLVAPTGAH